MIELDTSKLFVNLRIYCVEKIKDFVQAFKLNLSNS